MTTKKTTKVTVLSNTIPVVQKGRNFNTTSGHRSVIEVNGMIFVSDGSWTTPDEAVRETRKAVE